MLTLNGPACRHSANLNTATISIQANRVSLGSERDPGVEFAVAHSLASLFSVLLEASKRFTKRWFAAEFPLKDLFPPTKLPLWNSIDYEILPGMTIQLTTFACGGIVAGVK